MDFICPLCLEGTKQTMLFSCQHYACLPCLQHCVNTLDQSSHSLDQFTEPTVTFTCPLCLRYVTCLPAYWMDSRKDNEQDDKNQQNKQDIDIDNENQQVEQDNEQQNGQKSKVIISPLGHDLIVLAEGIRGLDADTVDRTDNILEVTQTSIKALEVEMEQALQAVRDQYSMKMEEAMKQCEIQLNKESIRLKQAQHEQDAIVSTANTIAALAYQPTEIIDQFFPEFPESQFQLQLRERIESYASYWPFDISPFRSDVKLPYKHLAYVPAVQDFVYFSNGHLYLGNSKSKCTIDEPIVIKVDKQQIYCFFLDSKRRCTAYIYNFSLKHLETVGSQLYGSTGNVFYVKDYRPRISHEKNIYLREYVDGVMYESTRSGVTALAEGKKDPAIISDFQFFFFKDEKIQFYTHSNRDSRPVTYLDTKERQYFDGHGHFYPGVKNSVLYKCGDDCKIIFPDLPTHKYMTSQVKLRRHEM